ncbi:MAG: hypothetical protein ABSG21_06070 [Spirochaetia bacterium]|jgi:hypothetical protein
MVNLLVRYKVKADKVAENEGLVRAVYSGLREIGDPDVHYIGRHDILILRRHEF